MIEKTDVVKELPSNDFTSARPITKTEFFNYMDSLSSSIRQVLEKKLAGILDNPL